MVMERKGDRQRRLRGAEPLSPAVVRGHHPFESLGDRAQFVGVEMPGEVGLDALQVFRCSSVERGAPLGCEMGEARSSVVGIPEAFHEGLSLELVDQATDPAA